MASKVSKITVSNLKAVSELTADFNGCTAIITGGNNKGKSSFLRSLPDRIHGIKPDVILKKGEVEGQAEWVLTSGEKFIWNFWDATEKKKAGEKLTFITDKGIKGSVTRDLALRYFPPTFNVDDFLNATPKKQKEILQKLVGLDFTDVDARYEAAYLDREGKNRKSLEQKIILEDFPMPEEVKAVSLDQLMFDKAAIRNKLNVAYLANKKANDTARTEWNATCEQLRVEWQQQCESEKQQVEAHNKKVATDKAILEMATEALTALRKIGYKGDAEAFVDKLAYRLQKPQTYAIPVMTQLPPEPTYIPEMPDDTELKVVDEQILNAQKINQAAQKYVDWKAKQQLAIDSKRIAEEADTAVKIIEEEKMAMIRGAKMPEGFGFSGDGITYTDLPFTREQLSSSGIYIAALKLAAMTLGEVRTLHFDASFLDRNSLADIEAWAASEGLQLLIERPDWDGGEIKYELINEVDESNKTSVNEGTTE